MTSKLASEILFWQNGAKNVDTQCFSNTIRICVSLHNILTKMTIWHGKDIFAEGEQNLRNDAFTNAFSLESLLNLTCNLEVTC